jgi:hypothetical protein
MSWFIIYLDFRIVPLEASSYKRLLSWLSMQPATPKDKRMTPRLKSSKIWTPIPTDFASKIKKVFAKQFKTEAQQGDFLIQGRIYPLEITIRIGYLEKGRIKQINFEASMDVPEKPQDEEASESQKNTLDQIYVCIDAIGSIMEEYFQVKNENELDIPLYWRPYEFEEQTVYLQYSTVNSRLEEEANRILGLGADGLYNEISEEGNAEDALGQAEIDTELALAVQKAIREGRIPDLSAFDPEAPTE